MQTFLNSPCNAVNIVYRFKKYRPPGLHSLEMREGLDLLFLFFSGGCGARLLP